MSVPALPRDAKSWLVENTVNRILRFLNPGFGADNAGKVLTSNSTGTDLVWQAGAGSTLTTRGDLLTRDAAALARLTVGASGTFLSSDGTDPSWKIPTLSYLTNKLSASVALNNTTLYFDGPKVSQGTSGVWLVTGGVVVQDQSGAANFSAKLWDGTTVIHSGFFSGSAAFGAYPIHLSGVISSPAGDLRISVNDANSASGFILAGTPTAESSTITAIRIG